MESSQHGKDFCKILETTKTSIKFEIIGIPTDWVSLSVKTQEIPKPNDVLNINGAKYAVLKSGGNEALIMSIDGVGTRQFNKDGNGQTGACVGYGEGRKTCSEIYENSNVDRFLDNDYYQTLPFKDAIIPTTIQQEFYSISRNPNNNIYQEYTNVCGSDYCWNDNGNWVDSMSFKPSPNTPNSFVNTYIGPTDKVGYTANKIVRRVFLPSVKEVANILNINSPYELNKFQMVNNRRMSVWFRDGSNDTAGLAIMAHGGSIAIDNGLVINSYLVRPTMTVDLLKLDYIKEAQPYI